MTTRIYLRASTKEQDAERAKALLIIKAKELNLSITAYYMENQSGTKLNRPELNRLLDESNQGDIILVESVDRLSRLSQIDFDTLKSKLKDKGLKLIVADLPTTYQSNDGSIAGQVLECINNMLVDLMATMARLDQEKRVERIKQGQERARELAEAKGIVLNKGGRPKNTDLRDKIKGYMDRGFKAQEIANQCDCGLATAYRVIKEIKLS